MKQPTKAFVGLGSNLQNPLQQIQSAISELARIPQTQLITSSSLYSSPPLPPITDQPDFINAVAQLETTLNPHELLTELIKIEQHHGRVREKRWGSRTLDLDVLLFGNQIINTLELIIPHPEIKQRNFVLYPLYEIAPGLQLPDGTFVSALLANHSAPNIVNISSDQN